MLNVKDLPCFIGGSNPSSPFTFAGTIRPGEGSTMEDLRKQAASCCRWTTNNGTESSLTINVYAPKEGFQLKRTEDVDHDLLRRNYSLISEGSLARSLADDPIILVKIPVVYVAYKHIGPNEPMELVVRGRVEAPPELMLGLVRHEVVEFLADEWETIRMRAHEAKVDSTFFLRYEPKGTSWKGLTSLLSCPGIIDHVPSGIGCLFIELWKTP